jgi:hypothetical protein
MRLVEEVIELSDSVDVPAGRVGEVDPINDAIVIARRELDTPTSPDAQTYEYEAVQFGDHYRVIVYGRLRTTGVDRPGDYNMGTFDDSRVLRHTERDVAGLLAENLTVEELREARRRAGASYRRGSTKRKMAEQLVDQAPEHALGLVRS